MLVYIVY